MRQDDSKLFYKIACTYFNEGQWESCLKQLETALRMHKHQAEFNMLAGECKMQLGLFKEGVQYFSNVVRTRPRNVNGWESLIRCLYKGAFYDEAADQADAAMVVTNGKPLFLFYKAAVLFSAGKTKEGLLNLEDAMGKSPKLLKKFIELNPAILQNQLVVDMVARYKRNKSI
jgi:tetratricopeptide (TPR) repeat protein